MSCALELLPNEVLDQIIFSLITEPPSLGQLHRNPTRSITQSQNKDLKHLARCLHRLLHIVRPRLFAHACLDLKDEWEFQDFILTSNFARYVSSLVVISEKGLLYPLREPWWHRIFSYLDPTRVTVLAPPLFIGNTLNTPVTGTDDKVFDIHFQTLQLEREGTPDVTSFPQLDTCKTLLLARPWTSMTFNESSFLKSYANEDYFLLHVPSILSEWNNVLIYRSLLPQVSTMLRGLTSFSYTAVLPFFRHVISMLDAMSGMPDLQTLSVQLAPDTYDQVRLVQWSNGWDFDFHLRSGEFAISYTLIIFEVLQKQSLVEFRSRDCTLEVIGEELPFRLDADLRNNNWARQEIGVWKRRK